MQTTYSVPGGMFDSTTVVETVDGFPRGDKAVDAAFFARMMQCFYSDGVVRPTGGAMQVAPGGGLTLTVAPGCAWIQGHMAWIQESKTAAVDAGCTYAVMLRLHRTDGCFTLEFLENQTALSRNDTLWDLQLAVVQIPSDAAAVTDAMITDTRFSSDLCGAVTSPVDALQSVEFAQNCGAIGGVSAENLVPRSGCTMTGVLKAANDTTGAPAVRNIRYGTTLPDSVEDGEIFILLTDA